MTATVPEKAAETAPAKKKCVACDNEIPADAITCPVCGLSSIGTDCKNCGKRIPAGAAFCTKCNLYQNKRKHLHVFDTVFRLILAFFAVLSGVFSAAAYLYDRNSDTRFWVTNADANVVHLKVLNTGRKPSRLVGYRLKFIGPRLISDSTLYQVEGDNVIGIGAPVTVGLSLDELSRSRKLIDNKQRYLKTDVKNLLAKDGEIWLVRVEVDIEESGHFWEPFSSPFVVQRSDTVPATQLAKFIIGRLPDLDTP